MAQRGDTEFKTLAINYWYEGSSSIGVDDIVDGGPSHRYDMDYHFNYAYYNFMRDCSLACKPISS